MSAPTLSISLILAFISLPRIVLLSLHSFDALACDPGRHTFPRITVP
jgi:hypothetical protein